MRTTPFLFAALVLTAMAGPAFGDDAERRAKDREDRRRELFEAANAGDAQAQSDLARVYGHYMSRRFDGDKGRFWLCQAAGQGHEEALINIALRNADWETSCPPLVAAGLAKQWHVYLPSDHVTRRFIISADDGDLTVPPERTWTLRWETTQDESEACHPACRSQLIFDGSASLGSGQEFAVSGRVDLNLSVSAGEQTVRFHPGTRLSLSELVGELEVIERVD